MGSPEGKLPMKQISIIARLVAALTLGLGSASCDGQVVVSPCSTTAPGGEDGDGQADEGLPGCVCGNGVFDAGEECDDGNTDDSDSCSNTCLARKVIQVTTGSEHACSLSSHSEVKCWGNNAYGQLGLGDSANRGDDPGEMGDNLPAVDLGSGAWAISLSAGYHYTCALLNDGSVKCWGQNDHGQLGLGDTASRGDDPDEMSDNLPAVDLGPGKTATAVSAGGGQTCALLSDGSVKCWGRNDYGQLGLGDTANRGDDPGEMGSSLPPVDLGPGNAAAALTTSHQTCALLTNGTVKCWGLNNYGQLGLGDMLSRGDDPGEMGDSLPLVDLGTGQVVAAVTAGNAHTCALLEGGLIKCWGRGKAGQLGLGDMLSRGDEPGEMGDALPPTDLAPGKAVTAISAGYGHNCARLEGGSVQCWAYNNVGQLGLGDTVDRGDGPGEMGNNLPLVDLGTGQVAATIVTGPTSWFTCALLHDGAVKCWGANNAGQLGLGDTEDRGDDPGEMGNNLPTAKLFTMAW